MRQSILTIQNKNCAMPFKTSRIAGLSLAFTLLLFSSGLFAQTIITGRIIGNGDKQGVPYATVQLKGERGATQTAADGTFSIKVPNQNGTLVISAVGFESLQYPIGGRSTLGTIGLNVSTSTLNDIIVTGYTDEATATMAIKDGKMRFVEATLRPKVTVAPGTDIDKAEILHHQANQECFIANSVNFPVHHFPEVTVGLPPIPQYRNIGTPSHQRIRVDVND